MTTKRKDGDLQVPSELDSEIASSGDRPSLEDMYQAIRDRICLLTYPPGMILREADFAVEFGVSRTPVRQVLQRLAFEGLLEVKNGVGTIVTGVDFRAFADVYELRLKLAEMIGEVAGNKPAETDIQKVIELQRRSRELIRTHDLEQYWRITHELHQVVCRAIANGALRSIYDLFYYQTSRIWYGHIEENWDEELKALQSELAEMLRVMRAGDVKGMGFVQRNYIATRLRRIDKDRSNETKK